MIHKKSFVELVREMRFAQKQYFENIGHFRKSKSPEVKQRADKFLQLSKHLEQEVDARVDRILTQKEPML